MDAFATPIELITSNNDALASLYNEDRIIHQMMDIYADKGYEQINLSNAHFYLDLPTGKKILTPSLGTLSEEVLEFLFSKSEELLNGARVRYLTGIRINFGFDGSSIQLLYQPVIMKWERFDGITMDDIYKVEEGKTPSGDPLYYCCNTGAVAILSHEIAETYIGDYKRFIRIKHNLNVNEQHTPHTSTDVESIIVAFQTVFSLLHKENSGTLFLHNCVRELKENQSDNVKHSILMSAAKIVLGSNSGHQFSNRSHLCPPCSNKVGYDVAE